MLDEGIHDCIKDIKPNEFELPSGNRVKLQINSVCISKPIVPEAYIYGNKRNIYPTECRQRKISYSGMCNVEIGIELNGIPKPTINIDLGNVPIMIKVSFFLNILFIINIVFIISVIWLQFRWTFIKRIDRT